MDSVRYLHLCCDDPLPDLRHQPFKALLIAEQAVDEGWRYAACAWLVRSGCLYFLAWGHACEAWHDRIDDINISEFEGRDIPEDKFVMTTWHEREALAEAMWFAAACAEHPAVDVTPTLIVHIAPVDRHDELMKLYRSAYVASD